MTGEAKQRTVVIAYDGSRNGEDALALGRVLCEVLDARPLLVTVLRYPDYLVPAAERDAMVEEQSRPIREAGADRLRGLDPRTTAIAADSPARALHQLAETEEPILVALGSTHRGSVGRVVLGSVGEGLLSGAPCAIAIAPGGYDEHPAHGLRRIGAAVNGSEESWSGFATAASLAGRLHASLTAIAVAEPPDYGYAASLAILAAAEYESEEEKHAAAVLDEVEQRAPSGISVERVVRHGLPETEIAAAADGLDLLVLGSRAYGPIRRTLLGGAAAKLMRQCPCPVLVLPRQAGDDPLGLGEASGHP